MRSFRESLRKVYESADINTAKSISTVGELQKILSGLPSKTPLVDLKNAGGSGFVYTEKDTTVFVKTLPSEKEWEEDFAGRKESFMSRDKKLSGKSVVVFRD